MKALKLKLEPLSPFGTFPRGDLLFGQFLYWGFQLWPDKFEPLFQDYLINGTPPIIFSDLLPAGFLPTPQLPLELWGVNEDMKKEFRKIRYISIANLGKLKEGIENPQELNPEESEKLVEWELRMRNSINRATSTTGEDPFNPYPIGLHWFRTYLNLYILYNPEKFQLSQILQLVEMIGEFGIGRRGTIGLGRFRIVGEVEKEQFQQLFSGEKEAHFLEGYPKKVREKVEELRKKLQPGGRGEEQKGEKISVPLHLGLAAVGCGGVKLSQIKKGEKVEKGAWCRELFRPLTFYKPVTKFGKFHNTGTPFKSPTLLAQTGGVYTFKEPSVGIDQLLAQLEKRELKLKKRDYFGSGLCNSINSFECKEGGQKRSLLQGFAPLVQFEISIDRQKLENWLKRGTSALEKEVG
jgi:CRISPR/Cas system CSM-associated protein Csm4 (group 5 of RAMP superfamily)